MRALLFDFPPPLDERPKDLRPSETPIMGAGVYASEVERALLRHGTYDEYYCLDRHPFAPPTVTSTVGGRPITTISLSALETLARHEHLVLMTPRSLPQALVPVRAMLGRPARPIVACIHTLSGVTAPYLAIGLMFANLGRHDALICSTQTGKRVVDRLIDLTADVIARPDTRPDARNGDMDVGVRRPVIPLGTDCTAISPNRQATRQRLGIDEATTLLLYVGRLSAASKCDLGPLLMTFARYLHTGPRAGAGARKMALVIAGDDTEHRMADAIRQWCHTLGCADAVDVRPDITDAERRDLLAAADIFLSFSDNIQETFGLTIIEAMAAGVPVVAADWDGYRELVEHGTTGFLVPTAWPSLGRQFEFNGPPNAYELRSAFLAAVTSADCEAIARYVTTLADNPSLRLAMGTAAQRSARARFDWPVIVEQYEALWSELVACANDGCETNIDAPGPFNYACQDVFGHYPTSVIADTDELTLSEIGRWWLSQDMPLETLPGSPKGFRNDLLRALAQRIATATVGRQPVTVGDLVRQHDPADHDHDELTRRLHFGKLFKYGLLRLQRSLPPL